MNPSDNGSNFRKKLDELQKKHESQLQSDLVGIKGQFSHEVKPALPEDIAHRLAEFDARLASSRQSQPPWVAPRQPQSLIDMTGSPFLKELDQAFADMFRLDQFFPLNKLDYPTVYCETLEQFFEPFLVDLNYSAQVRQSVLDNYLKEAVEDAEKGGGTWGVDISGRGCYLNGWLFAYGTNLTPRQALQDQAIFAHIKQTAVHEKLGHGFLGLYSAMGAVKNQLGLATIELASRFGLHPVDDPTWSLRQGQYNLLSQKSQLLEEGFASWVASFMAQNLWNGKSLRGHNINTVVESIQKIPDTFKDAAEIQKILLKVLVVLFSEERFALDVLQQAIGVVESISPDLDDYFFHHSPLGQPLRYAVGDLLFQRAEAIHGPLCIPYLALIAANLAFDPAQISLADLRELMSRDPRLNPDARLAALSQMPSSRPNDVHALAEAAEKELSFSVPKELK
jgi:hypothetical protein